MQRPKREDWDFCECVKCIFSTPLLMPWPFLALMMNVLVNYVVCVDSVSIILSAPSAKDAIFDSLAITFVIELSTNWWAGLAAFGEVLVRVASKPASMASAWSGCWPNVCRSVSPTVTVGTPAFKNSPAAVRGGESLPKEGEASGPHPCGNRRASLRRAHRSSGAIEKEDSSREGPWRHQSSANRYIGDPILERPSSATPTAGLSMAECANRSTSRLNSAAGAWLSLRQWRSCIGSGRSLHASGTFSHREVEARGSLISSPTVGIVKAAIKHGIAGPPGCGLDSGARAARKVLPQCVCTAFEGEIWCHRGTFVRGCCPCPSNPHKRTMSLDRPSVGRTHPSNRRNHPRCGQSRPSSGRPTPVEPNPPPKSFEHDRHLAELARFGPSPPST